MSIAWFDCKLGNILLDPTRTVAKIADVGLSKVLANQRTETALVSPCLSRLPDEALHLGLIAGAKSENKSELQCTIICPSSAVSNHIAAV